MVKGIKKQILDAVLMKCNNCGGTGKSFYDFTTSMSVPPYVHKSNSIEMGCHNCDGSGKCLSNFGRELKAIFENRK